MKQDTMKQRDMNKIMINVLFKTGREKQDVTTKLCILNLR